VELRGYVSTELDEVPSSFPGFAAQAPLEQDLTDTRNDGIIGSKRNLSRAESAIVETDQANCEDTIMATLTLQVSDESIVTLPAELAHQAGLEEGEVQVILGEHSLTVIPATPSTDDTIRWEAMSATLREQAAQLDFSLEDRRDASYWEIVIPLFEEVERTASDAHSGVSFMQDAVRSTPQR